MNIKIIINVLGTSEALLEREVGLLWICKYL